MTLITTITDTRGAMLWAGPAEDIKHALEQAIEADVDLREADLRGADLTAEDIDVLTGCGGEIAEDAAAYGYLPVELRRNIDPDGGAPCILYHCGYNNHAIATNGPTYWEVNYARDEWADALSASGLDS